MKTKKSPEKPKTVVAGDVFQTFIQEAQQLAMELNARRVWGNDVGKFLAEKSLIEEFEAWRKARAQTTTADT